MDRRTPPKASSTTSRAESREETGESLEEVPADRSLEIEQRQTTSFVEIGRTLLATYPKRTLLGLALFVGQAFLYNAVFFTQGLVLTTFFHVGSGSAGWYILPLAIGNFLGPLLLGRLFDTVGRRIMISVSYLGSGLLLVLTASLLGSLSATTLTAMWCAVFFLASAGTSAAYLTVSEIFPMETRAMSIALFYAVGTGLGGIIGPLLFGKLVATNHLHDVALGYYLGAVLMIVGGVVEALIGVEAEQTIPRGRRAAAVSERVVGRRDGVTLAPRRYWDARSKGEVRRPCARR